MVTSVFGPASGAGFFPQVQPAGGWNTIDPEASGFQDSSMLGGFFPPEATMMFGYDAVEPLQFANDTDFEAPFQDYGLQSVFEEPLTDEIGLDASAECAEGGCENETCESCFGISLTPEQQQIVNDMKSRDAEVVQHELAHAMAGGPYAGAPSYEYEIGPDGMSYAVAGEVPIDMSEILDDPSATIDKMAVIMRAALAPAEPSSQDSSVAGQASAMQQEAQMKLSEKQKMTAGETGAKPGGETFPGFASAEQGYAI